MNAESPFLTVDQLIQRIQAEAARRRGATVAAATHPWTAQPVLLSDAWEAPPDWATRREFELTEFLALPDSRFVQAAYTAMLGRGPDPEGLRHHLGLLRGGLLSKPDILSAIRASPEARRRNVRICGLKRQPVTSRLLRLPVVGRAVRWLLALRGLPALAQDQRRIAANCELLELQNARLSHELASLRHDLEKLRQDIIPARDQQ